MQGQRALRLTDLGKRLTRQAQDWRGALQKDLATTSWEQRILLVAVPTLLILAPWILGSNRLITVANTAGINAIALYGLALLYGQLGYLSLAHAALIGVGAYTGGILMDHIIFEGGAPVPEPFPNTDWATWGRDPVSRDHGRDRGGPARIRLPACERLSLFVILTFAFGALLPIVLKNWWISGRNEGILLRDPPTPLGSLSFDGPRDFYFLVLAFVFLAMIVYYLIVRSSFGRTLRGIRENETLAGAVGINTASYKIAIFAISGAFAGVAGVLFIHHFKSVNPPQFGGIEGVFFALMLLLGGPRWLLGPLVGAALIRFLPEITEGIGLGINPLQLQEVFGVLLIVVILFLPGGLVPGVALAYTRLKHVTLSRAGSSRHPPLARMSPSLRCAPRGSGSAARAVQRRRIAPHEPLQRTVRRHLQRLGDAKAVAFVEGNVAAGRANQITGDALPVAALQDRPHERRADATALLTG